MVGRWGHHRGEGGEQATGQPRRLRLNHVNNSACINMHIPCLESKERESIARLLPPGAAASSGLRFPLRVTLPPGEPGTPSLLLSARGGGSELWALKLSRLTGPCCQPLFSMLRPCWRHDGTRGTCPCSRDPEVLLGQGKPGCFSLLALSCSTAGQTAVLPPLPPAGSDAGPLLSSP